MEDKIIKNIFDSSKTIAMVGVSSIKENEDLKNVKRKPSIIVMQYLQEFGYKVIPVNPFSKGKKINGEVTVGKLEDISTQIDVVNVFRPSAEAFEIAKQAVKLGTKVIWLQYGIKNDEAEELAKASNVIYIANKCIKQEYQRLFLKMSPVFPALKTD